jgi:hypothetical protein
MVALLQLRSSMISLNSWKIEKELLPFIAKQGLGEQEL